VTPGRAASRQARGPGGESALERARARMEQDLEALRTFRPSYPFWRNVFMVSDGTVLYASAQDGRLLARFPERGDWRDKATWEDPSLAHVLDGVSLDRSVSRRRDQVADLLEAAAGPVVHNATRGDFLLPNVTRYGAFLDEWGAIYERFGVPAEIGLAQAIVESGLSGTVRSGANALGLCQWLKPNWRRLDRLTPYTIEIQNQTTQAAYCAAYLTVLATKYGSFIPALSEHHAGISNVGKVLVNGSRLGAEDVRTRYFTGADFVRDLRALSARKYRAVVGTFGSQSFFYSEVVFGNAATVVDLRERVPQEPVFALRTSRALGMDEITRRTGLPEREVKRFNPALFRQVPKGATLYLPDAVETLGRDVSYWHRPAPDDFAEVLGDFVALDATPDQWEEPAFEETLAAFRARFRATKSEEGMVMDAVLGYVTQELRASRRVLDAYRSSTRVQEAFDEGLQRRQPGHDEGR
ncbi:MAG TPA: transglycosylase SLT domain-containing protein, partial [Longimicrobiales bacterium]|nr:transglycosylase SLT domain-containing protein [Longimicrobiales bacterium]